MQNGNKPRNDGERVGSGDILSAGMSTHRWLDVLVVVGTGGDGAILVGELVVVLLAGAEGALLSSPRIF